MAENDFVKLYVLSLPHLGQVHFESLDLMLLSIKEVSEKNVITG